jgi:hypothetical protein
MGVIAVLIICYLCDIVNKSVNDKKNKQTKEYVADQFRRGIR